jgi:hypothetical protein
VQAVPHSLDPAKVAGVLRFRFPFPDEDTVEPGGRGFDRFDRGVEVPGYPVPPTTEIDHDDHLGNLQRGPCGQVLVTQQRWIPEAGGLCPVLRCSCGGALWRVEEQVEIDRLADCFRMAAYTAEDDLQAIFWSEMANRLHTRQRGA